jgi:hypothetical protein
MTRCDAHRLTRIIRVRRPAYARLRLLPFACAAFLLAIGCSRQADSPVGVTIEHTVSPEPPLVGRAAVLLKLSDPAATPISGAHITVEADMSHAGMAPVFTEASETQPGEYQAQLNFAMAGDWVILLHVRLPSGQTLERQFNVSGVLPN